MANTIVKTIEYQQSDFTSANNYKITVFDNSLPEFANKVVTNINWEQDV